MNKKWFLTASLVILIAVLLIPLMGFSSNAKGNTKILPNQLTLESGGIGVPIGVGPFDPAVYHKPTDGIISGAMGCMPDIHEFNKSVPGEHIVFTAGISEVTSENNALTQLNQDITIYVEITSNGQKVIELPFELHPADPNTGKPFWVSALYFEGEYKAIDLPTGEYNYKFKAKANGKNGHVLDVWVPKNHKFTVTDSSL